MITYSIIQKSQLEGAHRLDAEYYQPEYLEFAKKLVSIGEIPLGKIAFITDGQHGYHKVDSSSEIRHITAKNVLHWLVNDENVDRLAIETHNANKRSNLEIGDLLISTAGTIGAVGIVQEDILPANIDQDVARVHVLNQKEVDPYFLIAFLNSKYGQFQLIRETTGQIQTHVSLDKIKNKIFIPTPKWHDVIAALVKDALANLTESTELYSQAEDLLLQELGLKDFKVKDDLSYVVNFSDISIANRMDAEYFQPKYKKLTNKVKNLSESLGNFFSVRRGDFIEPVYYKEKAKRAYIRIKELPLKGDINMDDVTYVDDNFYAQGLETLEEGDFLFAGIGATLGKTARISKELEGSFYSNNTARFRLKNEWKEKIDTRYLQVVFQSLVCQWQFEKRQAQTAQAKIADEELKTVLIPILPTEIQKQIAEMVRKSHEARKKSKELLEEAKRKVEEMIEKGNKN